MTSKNKWQKLYATGHPGWDVGRPDFNLIEIVSKRPIQSCRTLEIGCGTGDNAIWLAQQGFSVTGIDIIEFAIKESKQKASCAGTDCTFSIADFMDQEIDGAPFDFVFDRGCFHIFDSKEDRDKFAESVASHLKSGGLWLSIIGSADTPPRHPGPPQRTASEIVTVVEPLFEILSFYSSHFESNHPKPPKAWVCLMQKRVTSQ